MKTEKETEFAKKVLAETRDYKEWVRCNSTGESDDYVLMADDFIDRMERWCEEYLGENK